jgi:hypothetical protein
MSLVIQNVSGAELDINDLGFGLASGAGSDLALTSESLIVSTSASGGDLQILVTAGDLVVKDPFDSVTNLSITDALAVLRSHNDPHYRMPIGGRIADAIDVDLTIPAEPGPYNLAYTGVNVVLQPLSLLDHSLLGGLTTGDPHTQYVKKSGDTMTGTLSISGSGLIRNNFGSAFSPAYSFNSDTDTGLFHPATDEVGLAAGGTVRLQVSPTDITFSAYPSSRDDGETSKALYVSATGELQYGDIAFSSVGGTSKRMDTWTSAMSGNLHYNDFTHNLGTTEVAVHLREFADNRQIEAEYTEIIDANTVRVVVDGNVEDIVCNVVSGSGPQGIQGPAGPGAALTIQDEGSSLTTDVAHMNFVGAGVTVTEPSPDQILVTIPGGGISDVVSDTTPQLGGVLDMNTFSIQAGGATITPTELSRLNNITSNVQTQLDSKTTPTGHTHVYRVPHTWGISGPIQVPTGQTGFILPMFVSFAAGQSASLVKCRYRINGGTSVVFKLQRNGVDVPGFTNITATTTSTNTDPVDVVLSDDDQLALVVTAVNGAPQNLSMTMFIEYTQ